MKLTFIFLLFLLIAFGAEDINAQEKVFIPTLNDHRFVGNRLSADPFLNSSFRSNTGVGRSQKVSLPFIGIGDSVIVPREGRLTFAHISIEANIKLNKAVTYLFSAGLSARVGSEPSSLYTNGLNTISAIHNAWRIRLFSNENHLLSTTLAISAYNASIINISRFIKDILDGAPNVDLSQKVNVLRGSGSIQYATAFGSVFGINVMGRYLFGDSFKESKSIHRFDGSLSLDINLYPKTNIPLGLSASAAYVAMPDFLASEFDATTTYNGRIAYTGSDSFIISLDVTSFKAPYLLGRITGENEIETNVLINALSIIIYFN